MSHTLIENAILYHYWRSSSSWRVRWALELKKVTPRFVHVDLLEGENEKPEHLNRNPMGYVPVLEVGGRYLIESVSIIEWLDQIIPGHYLFPNDSFDRAHVVSLVEIINADTQPVQNLTVLEKLTDDAQKRKEWAQYFIQRGFQAYETLCQKTAGLFSFGDHITAADLFLIPQCYNAARFNVTLDKYPTISKINENALKTVACAASHPDRFKPKE